MRNSLTTVEAGRMILLKARGLYSSVKPRVNIWWDLYRTLLFWHNGRKHKKSIHTTLQDKKEKGNVCLLCVIS